MSHTYPAVFSRQRGTDGPLLATFVAPAGEISKWAAVNRLAHEGTGYQRLRREAKVRAIRRFLERDERNSIPTALTVALQLSDSADYRTGECAVLEIPEDFAEPPGLVIDGQHRMYGVESYDPKVALNVIALINPTDDEIAFQFLVINGKASKVPTDHVKLLALQYEEHDLEERLKTARMVLGRHASLVGIVDGVAESPFYRAVTWPTEPTAADGDRNELVRPASIEQALAAVSKKNLPELADDDSLLDFFFTLWHAIREFWPDLWHADSKLLGKVGLVTLTMFVIDDLVPLVDRGDIDLAEPDVLEGEIKENILAYLAPEFWTSEWTAKSLDTSAGRQLVVDALKVIRRNVRRGTNWNAGVELVTGTAEE